mgnify:CR=1 FL=1
MVRPSRSSARAIKMPPQATFGAHLRAVRICFSAIAEKQYPYPAQPSVNGVCKGESSVPLCPVLVSFAGAKETPRRRAVQIRLCKRLCDTDRREVTITLVTADNPSVAAAPCQLPLHKGAKFGSRCEGAGARSVLPTIRKNLLGYLTKRKGAWAV